MRMNQFLQRKVSLSVLVAVLLFCSGVMGQDFRRKLSVNDTLVSPKILDGNQIRFSIYAPNAGNVLLDSYDMLGTGDGMEMTKLENGVWQTTVDSVEPGAYRYNFKMDGVTVVDPRNPKVSESNANVSSLVYLAGNAFMDTQNVPHGAIAKVTYFSKSLNCFRRIHVYTPPDYEAGDDTFPIFYLLHGSGDCDDSWSTVGRAGFILDNLIAEKKAVPMVVVMPAGHVPMSRSDEPRDPSKPRRDGFAEDFINDIMPYAESHYRVYTDRSHRAMAGLSMGGAQTLNIGIQNMELFSALGVFSGGIMGIAGGGPGRGEGQSWEERNKAKLDDAEAKKDLKLFWVAAGKDDFYIDTILTTLEVIKKHNFDVTFQETEGGHTWKNWRLYLNEFAPQLFR